MTVWILGVGLPILILLLLVFWVRYRGPSERERRRQYRDELQAHKRRSRRP